MTASSATEWPVHGTIDGPIVMIGFGSIGKGTLPLIERHFGFDRERFVVIDPNDADHDGIPDFSDDPAAATPPRQPQLTLARGETNLWLAVSGDVGRVHRVQEATNLSSPSWQTVLKARTLSSWRLSQKEAVGQSSRKGTLPKAHMR